MFQTSYGENQNTRFVFSKLSFFENRTVYDTTLKNIVEQGRARIKIWSMRISCWITKGTNKHSQYVIFIAFLLKQ
jgi:hypothetical protein